MAKAYRTVGVYAAGHFLVDLACMFLFVRSVAGTACRTEGMLLYNFFAFAGQMPLGLLADRLDRDRLVSVLGCVLVAGAYLLSGAPLLLCVTAGLGNALYHVGGGLGTLGLSEGRSGLLGIFVSPGAFGLFLGGVLAKTALPAAVPALCLLAAGGLILALCRAPKHAPLALAPEKSGLLALLLLFFVVVLRSYTGFLFSFPWRTGPWAWLFTAGVVLGKALGGLAADRFGSLRASVVSLGLAAALFLFSQHPACGVLAVLAFNMTMPVTLRAAADLLPGAKGFSFGLLTFALFLGFLPAALGLPGVSAGWMYAALSLVSLALLWAGLRKAP